MVSVWSAAPGTHAVQFYERAPFLYRTVVAFFMDALERGAPMAVVARRVVFDEVAARLAVATGTTPADIARRITFADAGHTLAAFMEHGMPDPVRLDRALSEVFADARHRVSRRGTVWVYGEMADLLCQQGNYDAAVRLETMSKETLRALDITLLCSYAIDAFDHDVTGERLRAISARHAPVLPVERTPSTCDDRTGTALLRQRSRALTRMLADRPSGEPAALEGASVPSVYVVDDDASVRKSLVRLLTSIGFLVRAFASGEEFLGDVDPAATGCLILDVQLLGLSGPDLQTRMARDTWTLPVIAMSGSHDMHTELQMRGLGATAFLRKPFDAHEILEAITRAVS